jgi:hypothetical protein
MAFYEYLLGDKLEEEDEENVEQEKQQNDDNDDDDDDDDDDDERAATTNATSDAEDDTSSSSSSSSSKQSLSNKDDDKDENSSIDTQEFLNQHDDACDVCYMGGELICCTTCSLVFHRECLRPISKTELIDWNCPHCIIQGLGGYKRHSKTWKRAEAGVRQMKRMRIEKAGGEQQQNDTEEEEESRGKLLQQVKREKKKKKKEKNTNEKKDGTRKEKNNTKMKSDAATTTTISKTKESSQFHQKKKKKDKNEDKQNSTKISTTTLLGAQAEATTKEEDSESIASTTSSSDNKKKRNNLALYKIADSYTPHCTKSHLVKGRRSRKQPALYQPQLCADSRWKSDEKIDGVKINDDDNDDDDDDDDSNEDSDDDGDDDGVVDDDDNDDDDDDDDGDGDYQDNDNVDDNKSKKEESKKETDNIIKMEVETDNRIEGDRNVHKKDNDDIQVQQEVQNDEKVIVCVDGVVVDDKKKASTTIWCNFCRDDPNIPICVFCGCRRCFGKHDKASLLLCDKCDEEYHTHCLGLTTVPLTQVWFCPNCEKKKKAVADLDSPRKSRTVISTYATDSIIQSDSSPARNSPSRKDMSASSTTKTPKSTQTVKTPKSTSIVKTSKLKKSATKIKVEGKKPRGRPPKNKDKIPASTPGKRGPKPKAKSTTKSTSAVPGRKRGRPRKELTTTKALKLPAIAGPPRKRGRPRKVESNPEPSAITGSVEAVPGKKRGPKPKPSIVTVTTITTSSPDTIKDLRVETESEAPRQENVKVSRISGRTVKRASFHDEIDEGEQHLRGRFGESLTPKSQEAQMHRNKFPESEPRKKQKIVKNKEDSATIQITPASSISESKSAKSRKIPKIQDKEDEMVDLSPVAPVRMKPVLQSPVPAMWPPPETATEDAYNLTNVTAGEQINDPLTARASAITDPGAAHQTQSPPSLLSGTNQPLVVPAKTIDPINVYPRPSPAVAHELPRSSSNTVSNYPSTPLLDPAALEAAVKALPVSDDVKVEKVGLTTTKSPRRKPGARECMQICRRFGSDIIPENHMNVLLDYCRRGKVEQLIRMRERLDCHSRFLESQLAGLEGLVKKVGESNVIVPALPDKFEPTKSIGVGAIDSTNIPSTLPTLSTVVNMHSTMTATIPVSSSTNVSTDPANEKKPASVQN